MSKEPLGQYFKSLSSSLALSFAMCFMLFIYAPLELYFTNKSDFWYDFSMLFPICILMFIPALISCVLLFCLIRLISETLYRGAVAVLFISLICTYVQGNFMVDDIPAIDGAQIDWSGFGPQRIHTLFLWVIATVVVFATANFFLRRLHKDFLFLFRSAEIVGICFSLMLFVSLFTLCIMTDGLEPKGDAVVTDHYMFELSGDRNFVILMLDAVDADMLIELSQRHPEYAEGFRDFTRYDDCMCAYPYTELCVPFLFCGDYYENDTSYNKYCTSAFIDSDFLNALADEGYRLGLYEPEAVLNDEKMYRFENIVSDPQEFSSLIEIIKVQIKLVGLRYMPYDLKSRCQVMPGDVPRLRRTSHGIAKIDFDGSNLAFYQALSENEITISEAPCFRFIHIEGGHIPYRYDALVNEVPEESATYEGNVEAGMTIALSYIEKLRESGVYDNSVIIIMSDHGYNRYDYNSPFGRQHPILFIKGIGESHDIMQISSDPVSHEDFHEACLRLLAGQGSSSAFDCKGDEYTRRYLFYYYGSDNEMEEFVQTGYASSQETLISTGMFFRKK